MGNRTNRILIGVIFLLIGLISLVQNVIGDNIGINYVGVALAVAGFAFLLLYKTKQKTWSLLLGAYMTCIGVAGVLGPFMPEGVMTRLIAAMCFMVPGVIFITLYYQQNRAPFLVPGSLLSWVGLYIILAGLPFLRKGSFGLLFICAGLGFCMVYVLGKEFYSKFSMYFGILLSFAGLVFMGGLSPSIALVRKVPSVGSVVLIGVSIYIIVKAIRKE